MTDIPEKTRTLIRERAIGLCELCRQPMTDIHHRIRRGMGGSNEAAIHAPSLLLAVCRRCHGYVHANPEWSIEAGWMIRTWSFAEPSRIWMQSVQYAYPAWFELDDQACVTWLGDSDEPAHLPPGLPSLRLDPWALDASA